MRKMSVAEATLEKQVERVKSQEREIRQEMLLADARLDTLISQRRDLESEISSLRSRRTPVVKRQP